jgi:hypothetical protein
MVWGFSPRNAEPRLRLVNAEPHNLGKSIAPVIAMCKVIYGLTKVSASLTSLRVDAMLSGIITLKKGETAMAERGSKDKGKREQMKKAQLSPKEKRKLKKEKKGKSNAG